MIYYYEIFLVFYKNNTKIIKTYKKSFLEITDFLYEKKKKNSSMTILKIKPWYRYY